MRTILLALATFSTLLISNDAEAMLGWLRGSKKSGSQQGTEMAPLSSSVPRNQNLRAWSGDSSSQPIPPAQRTMSTNGEDTSIILQRGSAHSESYGIPIPSKSAPGTPIQTRRGQELKDKPTAASYTPETFVAESFTCQFTMEGVNTEGQKPNLSQSTPIPGKNEIERSPDQDMMVEPSSFGNQTPPGSRESESEDESPFPNFDEDNLDPTKTPFNIYDFRWISPQPEDGFTVGSVRGQRPKTNTRGEE